MGKLGRKLVPSLHSHPMPPRITEEAVGHESQIGPWLATLQPRLACQFQRTDRRRHDEHETPTGGKKHGGPVAPRLKGPLRDRAKRSSR